MRAEIDSPTYHGGLWRKGRAALVDPARLAWGLKRVALDLGVRIHEHTKVDGLERDGKGMKVTAPFGRVLAGKVALGTNAFPPLVRAIRRYIVPVYDYVLVTEPLTSAQLASIGWAGRQGLSTTPTSSTTTGSPPTIASCGAATTPSTTSGARSARRSSSAPRHS